MESILVDNVNKKKVRALAADMTMQRNGTGCLRFQSQQNPCECQNGIVKCRRPSLRNLFDHNLLDDVIQLNVVNGNAYSFRRPGLLNDGAVHKRVQLEG